MSDNNTTSKFQVILIVVFIVFFIIAVMSFAGIINLPGSKNKGGAEGISGKVLIWGTLPKDKISPILDGFTMSNKDLSVFYTQKDPRTYDRDLIEAFASGETPDIFMLPSDFILKYSNKITPLPYTMYPAETFKRNFIQEAEIYMNNEGILALPITIDPIVMYYNRDMLQSSGIANPPVYWDELKDIIPKIVKKDNAGNISKSALSFGQFSNVNHVKEILSMLLFQISNQIVGIDSTGKPVSVLAYNDVKGIPPSEVMNFYGGFTDPSNPFYSWNKAMPNSLDAFASGDLLFYFGYSSELPFIQSQNPNLNFDVTIVPQIRNSTKVTTGNINALALSKLSKNVSASYFVIGQLTSPDINLQISNSLSLPPVLRDLLAKKPATPSYASVFYDSSLIARGWLDPSYQKTDKIFKDLVENIASNRYDANESISKANTELNLLLTNQ